MEKELIRKKRYWACMVIQRWTKGHLARKRYVVVRSNACYVRKLRRMLSVAIKKLQSKMIRNLVFVLTKAAKDKLNTKKVRNNDLNARRQQHKIAKTNNAYDARGRDKPQNTGDPYINGKIIAFVRGWKIRKIMKCQEVVSIIKRCNDVSISIKMSQFNPQTRNFIRDYMHQKSQIVDYFLSSIHRLYWTGDWVRSYKPEIMESVQRNKKYNSSVVVDLSTARENTSSFRPPLMNINTASSQAAFMNPHQTPVKDHQRDITWVSPQYRSPGSKMKQNSPIRNLNFNPLSYMNMNYAAVQNQRYAMQPTGISISDNRPSDLEAMNLVSQVLGQGSPIHNLLSQNAVPAQRETAYQSNGSVGFSHTPVVPEFQHPSREKIRETIEIPTHFQASTTTFTPINIDDIPIKPHKVDYNEASNENYAEYANSTLASIEVPKYNFEEILERALQEQGEPTTQTETEQVEPAKNSKKPKFLKRKKRYDPNEAIKKEKKAKSKYSKIL
jgi:hypothetical protein